MLDIRQLRSDPQGVAANLARRGFALDLEQFTALEARRKEAQVAVDALRNERNTRSKAIGHAKAKGEDVAPLLAEVDTLGARLAKGEQELTSLQAELDRRVQQPGAHAFSRLPQGARLGQGSHVRHGLICMPYKMSRQRGARMPTFGGCWSGCGR